MTGTKWTRRAVSVAVLLGLSFNLFTFKWSRNNSLEFEYYKANLQLFDGKLPAVEIRWEDLGGGVYGRTTGTTEQAELVRVDPKMNPSEWETQNTVWHEACHTVNWKKDDGNHGEDFQACVAKLARKTGRNFYDIF